MDKVNNYNFEVKTIRFGQPRPYADSEYEFEITSECGEWVVKQFCTNILKQCTQDYAHWNKNDANSYFGGYYTFSKTSDNTYKYYVKKPFCD
jgi:hypothetical protein